MSRKPRTLVAVAAAVLTGLGLAPATPAGSASAADDAAASRTAPGTAPPRAVAAPATVFRNHPAAVTGTAAEPLRVRARDYRAYTVDTARLADLLAGDRPGGGGPLRVSVPDPDGALHTFSVTEDPVLAPRLQAAHPEIRAFAGRDLDDPSSTVRLDLTPMGFHASVRDPHGRGDWLVDPAHTERGETLHLAYDRADLRPGEPLREPAPATGGTTAERAPSARPAASGVRSTAPGAPVQRRTYRLALVSDPSYARFVGEPNVLAEKAALVDRVEEIYNDDLGVRLVLADGSDRLDLDTDAEMYGADGPCGPSPCYTRGLVEGGCAGPLLQRNTFALGQLVGADSFDLGHIVLGEDGGGLAGLGVVGGPQKAAGCTGLTTPTGDLFAIEYVAHELGHQLGADHTFDGVSGGCDGNRDARASVEPGSGATVMSYAGICGDDDLQLHGEPYFSQHSLDQVADVSSARTYRVPEEQTVALGGFGRGDAVVLGFGAHHRKVVAGRHYDRRGLTRAMRRLTDRRVAVRGFPGGGRPGAQGFSLRFPTGAGDQPRLEVLSATSGVTAMVGVRTNGGPTTNGGRVEQTSNHAPAVRVGPDRTIPQLTPFRLGGEGEDADRDPLVYLWEQDDSGGARGARLLGNRNDGPLFRVFGEAGRVTDDDSLTYHAPGEHAASDTTYRVFPDLAQVLAGHTNAATGRCPTGASWSVDCFSELLPTAAYDGPMHFRLTARDLYPTGGGTQHADVRIGVGAAGPFLVTSQGGAGTVLHAGQPGTVTWDVAGTGTARYATQVRVLYGTGDGSFHPLVDATENDGSVGVTWPAVSSSHVRIMVEALDNYFFDVSDADVIITP